MTINTEENLFNAEAPFTELFSILKRYHVLPEGDMTLAYNSDELKIMHKHVDNATDVLLKGLQNIGNTISILSGRLLDLENIGYFITIIGNLTEALNAFRSDADFTLKQRGIAG